MGADSSIAFSKKDITSIKITWGDASTLTLSLVDSTAAWDETGEEYADVMENGQHLATPQARITADGTISGSLDIKVASWEGSSNVHPYEAFTWTGNAAAKTTTGAGDKKMAKIGITYNSTNATGGISQLVEFPYCVFEGVSVKESNGLIVITCNWVNKGTRPAIT